MGFSRFLSFALMLCLLPLASEAHQRPFHHVHPKKEVVVKKKKKKKKVKVVYEEEPEVVYVKKSGRSPRGILHSRFVELVSPIGGTNWGFPNTKTVPWEGSASRCGGWLIGTGEWSLPLISWGRATGFLPKPGAGTVEFCALFCAPLGGSPVHYRGWRTPVYVTGLCQWPVQLQHDGGHQSPRRRCTDQVGRSPRRQYRNADGFDMGDLEQHARAE